MIQSLASVVLLHLTLLNFLTRYAQNILQAADQLGIKSINSKNDYKAIKPAEQFYDPNKFSGNDDTDKEKI